MFINSELTIPANTALYNWWYSHITKSAPATQIILKAQICIFLKDLTFSTHQLLESFDKKCIFSATQNVATTVFSFLMFLAFLFTKDLSLQKKIICRQQQDCYLFKVFVEFYSRVRIWDLEIGSIFVHDGWWYIYLE